MADMISFGDWVRQRRRTLHLTQAILADRVGCAVVTIKKIEQEVRRPSIEMAEILADQLGVSSVDRPRFLAMARGQMLDASPAVNAISLPPFLVQPRQHSQPRLVTRPIEMECLSSQLQQMLMARVQLCFIRGEAGRGKTSLMQAFAHQAQRDVPELIIAKGSCSAHIGQGDPFLPIRDIFDCLTGDIEAHVQANLLDFGLARRLWHFMPEVAQSLIDEGSDLFEILVSPSALHTRLNDAGVTQISGIDRLWQISQQPAHRSDQTQSQLFEQITRVLGKLSQSKPLLLLFDDLQWIDETSLALLFHLSRRLLANRIMIVATYRGSELADAHPLRTTLAELTRRFGNIELDLEAGDVQDDRAFFEALVDQQAPQLDDAFRNHLFALTDGHPLFTVELLHHLQQENYLVRDKQGEWVQEKNVYFETLPSRIDAVISQRISQLDVERQEILRVAAIEGERFTAQVVAATLNMDERVVLSHLTHLAQHHGIVQEYSHERLEQRYLSRYQFRHALFTQYLYRSLGQGERYLLHQATAQKLEQLAGSQHEKYAMTLAYHYGQAGDTIKSAKYHYVAGDQARQASALIEALNHYEVALARWPPDQAADRAELLCKRADCLRTLGRQADALPLLEEAHALFTEIDNPIRAGDTLRRSGRLYWELGESKTGALYYQKALALLETCPESV
ncbi:MAG: AAA family ATPase, partial [Chloroflexota bacterium]